MSPKATKLRLRAERAEREYNKASEKYKGAWTEYIQAYRAEGYCGACTRKLEECKCVLIGGPAVITGREKIV